MRQPLNNQAILPVKKQELVAFIHDTYNTPPGEPIKLSRAHFTGRFITALRKYSNTPVKQKIPDGWFSVIVEFPNPSNSTTQRHFNYFPLEHIEQINDYMQAAFDLFFHVYFFDLSGLRNINADETEETELTKMHLVDSFVAGLNLVDLGSANEMIKKREYRKEVEILTKKRKSFIQKERRFRAEIYKKRKQYIKNILNQ
jgi:hypothetical protein